MRLVPRETTLSYRSSSLINRFYRGIEIVIVKNLNKIEMSIYCVFKKLLTAQSGQELLLDHLIRCGIFNIQYSYLRSYSDSDLKR